MKRIGIFYASSTGTTEEIALQLAKLLDVDKADVRNVASSAPTEVADFDIILLGTSTWGAGDMEDDMIDFADGLKAIDLTGKQVALFGCGDTSMADTFCDGVGTLYDDLIPTNCTFIDEFNVDGYTFNHSKAVRGGKAVGLLIDNVNHPDLTPTRLDLWATTIQQAAKA
ncbi:MAG: flavodoxin [Candidatus Amulumruptor caecigallinarius]|nr:flavodoxin [Candidatus Amulumruptor caecigallinarius]MCM1396906.1 flavodoxin [Candidatus Amulumruptor caecigallinarius]MCM1454150.1 flavodoxin [bacterium]